MCLYTTTSPSLNATSIPVQNTCNCRLIIHVQSLSEFDATRIFSLSLYIRRSYNTFCGSNIISGSVWKVYLPSPLFFFCVCFFQQAARNLKNTESLKACHRCGSPAKYDSYLHRATCNRESCGFDFCTKCMCSYHSSSDCVSSKPVKHNSAPGPLPGTKKSKQNLKRL